MSSSTPAALASSQADPLRRTAVACIRCRKRKTKCLGVPCQTCALGRHECVFPDAQKKVLISEDYLADLEARVEAFESARDRESPFGGTSGGSTAGDATLEVTAAHRLTSTTIDAEKDDFSNNPLTEGIAKLMISPSGEHQFQGDSSSTSLAWKFFDFAQSFGIARIDSDIEIEIPTYSSSNFTIRRESNLALLSADEPPPFAFAKVLYAAQYAYIGTIFSFVEPSAYESRLGEVYSRKLDFSRRRDCLVYCQIYLIFAFGEMYSVNQWTSHEGPPGFDYFQKAMQFLPDIHEHGSVIFVEVLSLIGYFFQNLNRRDAAFLYIGLALRMAISLGLHQEVADSNLDETAREHRRRLWWSVYSMDRILCVKSGNPLTIADDDIGVSPPSRLSNEPEACPATVLLHYTELSRILGSIMKNIYRKNRRTGSNLVSSVRTILADLSTWHTNLPPALRFDFTKLDSDISRESVSIFLHYSQCINMTARPLLFHVIRKRLQNNVFSNDWRTGLSPTTIAVVDTCISAARNSTAIMAAAAKQNLIATYGYMDGEHAFSAAIVLVMVNIGFPYNSRDRAAMDQALTVLNSMADKGNSYIKSLHRLLLNFCPLDRQDFNDQVLTQPQGRSSPAQGSFEAFSAQNMREFPSFQNDGFGLVTTDEMLLFENATGDVHFWEEGYRNFDANMDFDYTLWTE